MVNSTKVNFILFTCNEKRFSTIQQLSGGASTVHLPIILYILSLHIIFGSIRKAVRLENLIKRKKFKKYYGQKPVS